MSGEKVVNEDEVAEDCNYKPPAEKSLQDIIAADEEDESLKKYKEALLGQATKANVIIDESNPKRVIVKNLVLLVPDRPELILNLENLDSVKKQVFTIKEGIQYRIRIDFYVQREIVTGLRYSQKIHRHGLQVEKMNQMVGSYAPKAELQSYTSPEEHMPEGMLYRGTYTVKSLFTDDDKNEHLKWDWTFELKKDWA